jgi:hypothetical protein
MLCWLLSLAYEFDSFCPPHKKLTPASKVNWNATVGNTSPFTRACSLPLLLANWKFGSNYTWWIVVSKK